MNDPEAVDARTRFDGYLKRPVRSALGLERLQEQAGRWVFLVNHVLDHVHSIADLGNMS
jgi:hypothetical protein